MPTSCRGLAPKLPGAWYALGQAYNAVAQEAIASFEARAEEAPWRQLLVADGLARTGHFTDAFVIYRSVQEQLPSMVSIHDVLDPTLESPRLNIGFRPKLDDESRLVLPSFHHEWIITPGCDVSHKPAVKFW